MRLHARGRHSRKHAHGGCVLFARSRSRSPAAPFAASGTRATGECNRGRPPPTGPREVLLKKATVSISAVTIERYRIAPPRRGITRAAMLTIADLTYRIAGRTLIEGAAAQINAGW